MLKLILATALVAPCFALPFVNGAGAEVVSYETASFEDYFIAPELAQLEACNSAQLDVFFHGELITTHSAEFVGEAVALSSSCGDATYVIRPIAQDSFTDMQAAEVLQQANELLAVLEANGVNAKIMDTEVQKTSDNLTLNGRAAILNIDVDNSEAA